MLNKLRNFSKGKLAGVLVGIIIIPFVFWGMGGVFNTGNTNNIVKIDNHNIPTQDFMNYMNASSYDLDTIKNNIDNNVIEEILSGLISKTLIELEIQKLNISISDKILVEKIKNNKNFLDDKNKFSRNKYEKFLLTNNIDAPRFEHRVIENELKKKLFYYISGGIKSPLFLTNDAFIEQTKNIDIEFINLNKIYKSKESFTDNKISSFVAENKVSLEEDYIDFSYVKLNPQNLNGSSDFNDLFFNKIDEIENKLLNGESFENIISQFNLKMINNKSYSPDSNNEIGELIYNKRNENRSQILDKNDYFLFYKIDKIKKILPELTDDKFKKRVKKLIFEKQKYEYNKKLIEEINSKNFNNNSFLKLSKDKSIKINKIKINSIDDNTKFSNDSVKLIYALPLNSFALVNDNQNNIYLVKISKTFFENIKKNSNQYKDYFIKSNIKIKDTIYTSYDLLINDMYNVKANEKTLQRVKNYFR